MCSQSCDKREIILQIRVNFVNFKQIQQLKDDKKKLCNKRKKKVEL